MSIKHRSPLYRIIGITLAFLLIGAVLFVPLVISFGKDNPVLTYIILGVYLAAYVATIVINEIVVRKRYPDPKKDPNDE